MFVFDGLGAWHKRRYNPHRGAILQYNAFEVSQPPASRSGNRVNRWRSDVV
jgi:hypothetical protein